MEEVFEKFNTKDALLVISSYPPAGREPAKQNAVACYSQNLLRAYKGREIVVFSEIVDIDKGSTPYIDRNILVFPCWSYRSPKLYLDLLAALARFEKPRQVLIQFEFNMLGSFVHSALLPFFVLIAKFMGKSVTCVMHQVVSDLASLSGHLNLKKNSLKRRVLETGLHMFYYLTGKYSDAVIVHEEHLRQQLSKWVETAKISVISHGLSLERQKKGKDMLRKSLGFSNEDFVLLMFGYLTWYKGTDWIIKKVKKLKKVHPDLNIKLIVAGGASATLKNKPHYKKFLKKLELLSRKGDGVVKMTGYVLEKDLSIYFTAADLVVLPYRIMMSASGPLSFALRFGKPFVISEALAKAFKNPDIRFVLTRLEMNARDFTFSLKGDDFEALVLKLRKERKALAKIMKVSSDLRTLRKWENIVKEYDFTLDRASQLAALARIRGAVIPKLVRPLILLVQ